MNARQFRHHSQVSFLVSLDKLAMVALVIMVGASVALPYVYTITSIMRHVTQILPH